MPGPAVVDRGVDRGGASDFLWSVGVSALATFGLIALTLDGDLPVTRCGNHAGRAHRYQVIRLAPA